MKKLLLFFCLLPVFCISQPGYIRTIAGNGTSGFSGDGGPATSASIGEQLNIFVDLHNNIYTTENGRVRKIDSTGTITTVAGGGSSYADGIPATDATLDLGALTTDACGNLFIADGSKVRKVSATTGIITTVVGTGVDGDNGDGGVATSAQITRPFGICFDYSGNMYMSEEYGARIRKINTAGIISTYAGTGVSGFSGDGGPATSAKMKPNGLCMDTAGNMYFADRYNYRIRKISASGIISTYAGLGSSGFAGDGGPASAARFSEPSSVCMDASGNLYIADFHNGRIRRVSIDGLITTFAGGGASPSDGVPATTESFTDTWGVAIDDSGNIYVPDRNNYRICKVNGTVMTTTVRNNIGCATEIVASITKQDNVTIFPNPATDELTIKTETGAFDNYTITNNVGQVLMQQKLNSSQTVVNINHLNPGLYYITLKGVNGSVTMKFVKM